MRSLRINPRASRILVACAAVLSLHGPARAQAVAPPADPPPIRIGPVLLTGYIQYDYRLGSEPPEADGFFVRRARVQLAGPMAPGINWTVSAEATGTPVLRDAYILLDHLPAANVQIGQFIMPFSYERSVASSNTLEFPERQFTSLAPGRDAGLMVSNERPFFGWLSYAAAIANGPGQNVRDDNGAKDAMLRVTASPQRVPGLHLAVNGVRGEQPDGLRTRTGADVQYETRLFHVATEFLRQRSQDGQAAADGFLAFGSWRIYPGSPVPGLHHLELATRFSRHDGPERLTREWDFALNYYAHRSLRFMFDLIVPSDPEPGDRGVVLHTRANIRF